MMLFGGWLSFSLSGGFTRLTNPAADKLLKFAETEDSRFKEIMSHKATIEDDSLDLRDPALKRAIGAVWSACTSLSADAEGAERDARALMEELRRV